MLSRVKTSIQKAGIHVFEHQHNWQVPGDGLTSELPRTFHHIASRFDHRPPPLATLFLIIHLHHSLNLRLAIQLLDPVGPACSIQLNCWLGFIDHFLSATAIHGTRSNDDRAHRIGHLAFSPEGRTAVTAEDGGDRAPRVGLAGVLLRSALGDLELRFGKDHVDGECATGDLLAVAAMADSLCDLLAMCLCMAYTRGGGNVISGCFCCTALLGHFNRILISIWACFGDTYWTGPMSS
jgi:hypothetical protein